MPAVIKENEPLSRHTTLHVGGVASYFIEARSEEQVLEAVHFAGEKKLPFFILGGGSNTLADDKGFDGVVIKIQNNDFVIEGETVTIGAGHLAALAARKIAVAGLTGFEWAVTLPGTIGGAVFGNAGCFGGEMGDVLVSVRMLEVLRKSQIIELKNTECRFGYRNSIFKTNSAVILNVTLKLKKGEQEKIKTTMQQFLDIRKTKQPLNCPSAGCMFKNYEIKSGEQFIFSVPTEFLKIGKIPAGWLVEQAGGKGLNIGPVKISEMHGNFLLNTGHATAGDIKGLVKIIQEKVQNKFGIQLEMEVRTM